MAIRRAVLVVAAMLAATIPQPATADHPDLTSYDELTDLVATWESMGARTTSSQTTVEGREIHLVQVGTGPVTVLALGAIHANEPAGTEALVRLIWALLGDQNPTFDQEVLPGMDRGSPVYAALADPAVRAELLSRVTLAALPMSEPDGVENAHTRQPVTNLDYTTRVTATSQAILDAINGLHPDLLVDLHGGPPSPDLNVGFIAPSGTDPSILTESLRSAEVGWRAAEAANASVAYFEEHPSAAFVGVHGEPFDSIDEAYYDGLTQVLPLTQESVQLLGIPAIYNETVGLQSADNTISLSAGASIQEASLLGLLFHAAGMTDGTAPQKVVRSGAEVIGAHTLTVPTGADRLVGVVRWDGMGQDYEITLLDAAGGEVAVTVPAASEPSTGRVSRSVRAEGLAPGTYTVSVSQTSGADASTAALRVLVYELDDAAGVSVLDRHSTVRICADEDTAFGQAFPDLGAPRCPLLQRRSGAVRVETAANISRAVGNTADTVVITRADEYAEALVGAPLAVSLGGPLLLTDSDRLSEETADDILRLSATRAVVLGGTAAVSPAVVASLEALGVVVERISGADRYATAAAVAARLGSDGTPLLAEGENSDPARGWPDAVSAAGLGAATGRPVLLTRAKDLPPATAEALVGAKSVTIVGGVRAVGADVESTLTGMGLAVQRLSGPDRFATSVAAAEAALASGAATPAEVWLATGLNFPDGLASAAATGAQGGILLLIDGEDPGRSPAPVGLLTALQDEIVHITISGGTAALSTAAEAQLAAALSPGS